MSLHHLEHREFSMGIGNMNVNMLILYHHPPSRQNGFNNVRIFTEWLELLYELSFITYSVIITGELNIYVCRQVVILNRKMLLQFVNVMFITKLFHKQFNKQMPTYVNFLLFCFIIIEHYSEPISVAISFIVA